MTIKTLGTLAVLLMLVAAVACTSAGASSPTTTPTPTPRPTIAPGGENEPPTGPGVEIGRPYPFSLYVHCGVRDAKFDGRWWMANPMLGDNNPPAGWTRDDVIGEMELVEEELAVFTAKSGRTIEFIPWPSDVKHPPCL